MGDVRNLTIGVGFEVKTDKLTEADNVLARLIQSAKTLDSTATASFAKIVEESRKAVSAIKENDATVEKLSLRLKTAGEAGAKTSFDVVSGLKTVESEIVKTVGFVKNLKGNFETLRNSCKQMYSCISSGSEKAAVKLIALREHTAQFAKGLDIASISGTSFGDGLNKGVTQADSVLAGIAERVKQIKSEMSTVEPPKNVAATIAGAATSTTDVPKLPHTAIGISLSGSNESGGNTTTTSRDKLGKDKSGKTKPEEKPKRGIKEIFKDSFSPAELWKSARKDAALDKVRDIIPKKPAGSQQFRPIPKYNKIAGKYEDAVKKYGLDSKQAKSLKAKVDKQAVEANKESEYLSKKAEEVAEGGAGKHSKKTKKARLKGEKAAENVKNISERVTETEKNAKPLTRRGAELARKPSLLSKIVDKGKKTVGSAVNNIKNTGKSVLEKVGNSSFGKTVGNAVNNVKNTGKNVLKKVGNSSFGKTVGGVVNNIKNKGENALKKLGNTGVGKFFKNVAPKIMGTGESGLAALKNGSGILGGIKTSLKGAGAFGVVENALDLRQALMTKGKDKNEKVGSSLGEMAVGSLGAFLGSGFGPLGTIAGSALGSAVGRFAGGMIGKSGVGDMIGKAGSNLGKGIRDFPKNAGNFFSGIGNWFGGGGKDKKSKDTLKKSGEKSKTTLPNTAMGPKNILGNIQGVSSALKNLLPSGKAASSALKGLSLGGKIASAGLNALASNSKNVKLGFGNLAGTIKGSLGVIGSAAGAVAGKATQGKTKTSSSTKKTTSTKSKGSSKGSKNSKKHANGTLGALSAFASRGYASNGGHPGGLATVNDADSSTYREAFLLPNGLAGLFPKKRNLTLALPKGTHVLNAQDTKQKFGAFYAKGTTGAPSAFSGKKDFTIEIKPEFNITAAAGMDLNELQKKVLAIVNPQLEMIAQVLTKQLAGA